MRPLLLLVPLLAACDLDDPGPDVIAVGNPPSEPESQLRLAVADGDGVVVDALQLPIEGLYAESCTGEAAVTARSRVLTLDDVVSFPVGTYCALGLTPAEAPAVLEGTVGGDATFTFSAGLGRVLLYGEVVLEEDQTRVLELAEPDWIDAAAFDLLPGEHRDIGGDDCLDDRLCEQIRNALMDRAGLYDDRDGDGEVSDEERDEGTEAAGSDRREPVRSR